MHSFIRLAARVAGIALLAPQCLVFSDEPRFFFTPGSIYHGYMGYVVEAEAGAEGIDFNYDSGQFPDFGRLGNPIRSPFQIRHIYYAPGFAFSDAFSGPWRHAEARAIAPDGDEAIGRGSLIAVNRAWGTNAVVVASSSFLGALNINDKSGSPGNEPEPDPLGVAAWAGASLTVGTMDLPFELKSDVPMRARFSVKAFTLASEGIDMGTLLSWQFAGLDEAAVLQNNDAYNFSREFELQPGSYTFKTGLLSNASTVAAPGGYLQGALTAKLVLLGRAE
ncbi:MAG: hypothetical protein NXI32_11030 [bacterium]|nr:hypothetical protein [bacterium]